MSFADVGEIGCRPGAARIFEHGWQSWSPSGAYGFGDTPPRAADSNIQTLCYRPETPVPDGQFQGEGLLAVDPGDGGPVAVFSAPDPLHVPSIRARQAGDRVVVSADGPVLHWTVSGGLDDALRGWADAMAEKAAPADYGRTAGASDMASGAAGTAGGLARTAGDRPKFRAMPPMWCTWYGYWGKITDQDVIENLELCERHALPADMFLIDDGYEAEIGDWLDLRPEFGSLERAVGTITQAGKRAGIWTAPFLVGHRSKIYQDHPDWLVQGVSAGNMWDQDLSVLDVTHPDAAAHLVNVFSELANLGISHFKLDFIYAGALHGTRHEDVDPIAAYRRGLELIRQGAGQDATLHGCGAPMLPSIGLVDVMRVGPDIAPTLHPKSGDISQPSQLGARLTSQAREFLHARWWVNDPDCIIVRPEVEAREDWAAFLETTGGLRGSSDPIASLDAWGLETTRRLMVPTSVEPT